MAARPSITGIWTSISTTSGRNELAARALQLQRDAAGGADRRDQRGAAVFAYLVVAWNRLHRFYDAPSEAFRAPYDATVEALLDGGHTDEEVFAGLPVATPPELFTAPFMALLEKPSGALERALRAADGTADWRPGVPVDLYAAGGDRDVPIANAHHALGVLRAQGADVRLVDVGEVDHTTSVVLSLPRVVARFDELGARA